MVGTFLQFRVTRHVLCAAIMCLALGCRNHESSQRVLEKLAGSSFARIVTIEKSTFDNRLQDSTLVWSLKHDPKSVASVLKQMGFGVADAGDLIFASQQVKDAIGATTEELSNLSLYRARLNDRDLYWLLERDMKRSILLILSY